MRIKSLRNFHRLRISRQQSNLDKNWPVFSSRFSRLLPCSCSFLFSFFLCLFLSLHYATVMSSPVSSSLVLRFFGRIDKKYSPRFSSRRSISLENKIFTEFELNSDKNVVNDWLKWRQTHRKRERKNKTVRIEWRTNDDISSSIVSLSLSLSRVLGLFPQNKIILKRRKKMRSLNEKKIRTTIDRFEK